jgi:CubicO group peptidase (beta-lactamase class C family)
MSSSTVMLWRSAGKPITATAVLQTWQSGRLSIDDGLQTFLPETRGTVVSDITIRQILSHSSGLPVIDTGWPRSLWKEIIQRICTVDQLTADAAYQPQSTWFLLAEILRRTDLQGRDFQKIISEDILKPLGVNEAWCGIPETEAQALHARLPTYFVREKGQLVYSEYSNGDWLTQPSPGGNMRGPVSGLGTFYEMLLAGINSHEQSQVLSSDAIRQMLVPQRIGKFDQTLQHTINFGLGVILDSNRYGADTVPYGFGRFCSPQTFGHGGAQCAMGFCDPTHQLVVAWAANGFCGEGQHQRRNRAINEAIYADLAIT